MRTINLLLVGIFALGALGIISDTIRDPSTLFLLIPITIFICYSPIGKAIGNLISGQSSISGNSSYEIEELKLKYKQLESKLNDYEKEVSQMRETIVFYDSKKLEQSKSNISLEKNL
ncbi:MAG: hypothetical protein U0354_07365 [Candidatus Sericytochromatia bacterium]